MKASFFSSFLLYLFIFQFKSLAPPLPCKLFPKILGGTLGDTFKGVIDANLAKDIIVHAGFTWDSGLAGFNLNGGNQYYIASF